MYFLLKNLRIIYFSCVLTHIVTAESQVNKLTLKKYMNTYQTRHDVLYMEITFNPEFMLHDTENKKKNSSLSLPKYNSNHY